MIAPLARAVAQDLKAREYPYPVSYGPERTTRKGFKQAIVFSRVRGSAEQVLAPPTAKDINPEVPYVRKMAGSAVVYAQCQKQSATTEEHEDECDRVCDGVITAMRRILSARRLPLEIVGVRQIPASEFSGEETWPGVAAEILFNVTVGVRDVNYAGAGLLSGVVDHVQKPVIQSDGYPDFDTSET